MRSASRTRAIGLVVILAAALLVPSAIPTASADEGAGPVQTVLELSADSARAGSTTTLRLVLTTAGGGPVPEASVTVERRVEGVWELSATAVTDSGGAAVVERTLQRVADDNRFRASYDGDATQTGSRSGAVVADLVKRPSAITIEGPASVVDGRRVRLRVVHLTRSGEPVPGDVRLQRRVAGEQTWRTVRTLRTGGQGKGRVRLRPRVDTRWRAVAPAQDWVARARSSVLRVDNLPPVAPVRLPRAAPEPRIRLPEQPRGTGRGAHPVVAAIPDRVWGSMTGRSWHAGCPVGRAGLRLLRVNYWGYDGYRYRGELVASAAAMPAMTRALVALFKAELPIRSMYRVDRFGWSARLQGADDYRSMAAGNTSAFNCRQVVNRPGVRSPHSYGGSLDVNPWENPYRSATGLVPNSWWAGRTHPRVAWRSSAHPVVRLMSRAGLAWTYGTGDSHHFDAVRASGRTLTPQLPAPTCGAVVCR